MKKCIVILISAILFCSVAASTAGAYSLYSDGKAAVALTDYPERLSELNLKLSEALTSSVESNESDENDENAAANEASPDTAATYTELLALVQEYHLAVRVNGVDLSYKLMDYDVLLKRLKIALGRYDRRLARVSELELLAKTGAVSQADLAAANDEASTVYYDIRTILFEISTLKSEIESITGERLRDTFDFESVYFITDALKLGTLSDNVTLSTICVPNGAEGAVFPKRDNSADLNSAVGAYNNLGAAIRALASAEAEVKNAKEQRRLGQLTAAEYNAVFEQREDRYLEAAAAKAAFSKALLALDISSGGGLVSGVSSGEASVLRQTVANSGEGLWLVKCTKTGVALSPVQYPDKTLSADTNDTDYTYTVSYNGTQIGSAVCGNDCKLAAVNYVEGVDTATVEFRRNGTLIKSFEIGVFNPYGVFAQ